MTRWQHAFLELLRCGLWGNAPDAAFFPLTAEEWHALYAAATRHTVQGCVYDALQRLDASCVPPWTLTVQWTADVTSIVAAHTRVLRAAAATHALLAESGHEPILLKGLASAHCYARPELRVSGDIDWYLPAAAFAVLPSLLATHGIACQHHPDGSVSFDHDGIDIEVHPQPADILLKRHREAFLHGIEDEGYTPLSLTLDGGASFAPLTLGPQATLVMQSAHLLKHASGVGIGLRQFCDMARACHVLHGRCDASALDRLLDATGLTRWHRLLCEFLCAYLGLSASEVPGAQFAPELSTSSQPSRACRRLLTDVLRWGNFGHHAPSYTSSKWHTATHILRRLPFSLHYAPLETLCLVSQLARGQ